MRVAFEADDYGPINSNFGLLEKLKEHYPTFKVTLFTVPWEIRFGRGLKDSAPVTQEKYKAWVEASKADWIEIALHGLTHAPMEFAELSEDAAYNRIVIGMKMFENVGFKNFAKIFKAPQWAISKDAKRAAENMGFKVVEDGYYNWNIANDKPNANATEPYIMHGHIQDDCGNGLEESFHRLTALPPDTEFLFLSEILGATKGDYNYYE